MIPIVPTAIEEIEVNDAITFFYDHTSRAGRVTKITKDIIEAENAIGDKYKLKFTQIRGLYKEYYQKVTS